MDCVTLTFKCVLCGKWTDEIDVKLDENGKLNCEVYPTTTNCCPKCTAILKNEIVKDSNIQRIKE